MTADGPTLPNAKICIRCGHCVAVCPVDALDFSLTPLANQKRIDGALTIDSEKAEQFLRSRRSIRNYRKKEVANDDLTRLLEVAQLADMPLEGTCEGQMACSTCHVYVDPAFLAKAGEQQEMEKSMLDFAENVKPNSRLSCQIKVTDELDGLRVTTPESQH